MNIVKAPELLINNHELTTIFLAGTIDLGNSHDWQTEFVNHFSGKNITFYNPRRDKWGEDVSRNPIHPLFFQQVNWELMAMEKCDRIVMNFLPDSKSPVSMLELGLHAKSGKLVVCCPTEFWRSGNIHLVCQNYNIPLFLNMEDLKKYIEKSL